MNTVKYFYIAILIILTSCGQDEATNMLDDKYEIHFIDSTNKEIIIKSIITERLTKEELIHIAYSEKTSRKWRKKFVIYFYLDSTNNPAYATAAYLKDCSKCNSLDPSNNKIDLKLNFGNETQNVPNAAQIENAINKELLVVSFYEDTWKANSYIVYDDEKKIKASKIMHYESGEIQKIKLIKESETFFREINNTYPEEMPGYRITGEFVEYVYTNGKIGFTYKILN